MQATTDEAGEKGTLHRPQPYLFVVLHCDNPMLGGARHGLADVDEVEFVRGPSRAYFRDVVDGMRKLQVSLPGTTVSRAHARLARNGDSWIFEDKASRNGSFINGVRVTSAPLNDGDDLLIGDVLLRYRAHVETPPGAELDIDSEAAPVTAPNLSTSSPLYHVQLEALKTMVQSTNVFLLVGAPGTGKEVLAKSMHGWSRLSGRFVPIACESFTATDYASRLFGHVKGAFPGASRDEIGYVRRADKGTLFLDEIGDLPLEAQAALVRVIQEGRVLPVGATEPVKVNVRVVASTQRRLDEMRARGELNGELWDLLKERRHDVAPLGDRIEDLGVLTRDILRGAKMRNMRTIHNMRLDTTAARALLHHQWSYHIRELAQVLFVALGLSEGATINRASLPIDEFTPAAGKKDGF